MARPMRRVAIRSSVSIGGDLGEEPARTTRKRNYFGATARKGIHSRAEDRGGTSADRACGSALHELRPGVHPRGSWQDAGTGPEPPEPIPGRALFEVVNRTDRRFGTEVGGPAQPTLGRRSVPLRLALGFVATGCHRPRRRAHQQGTHQDGRENNLAEPDAPSGSSQRGSRMEAFYSHGEPPRIARLAGKVCHLFRTWDRSAIFERDVLMPAIPDNDMHGRLCTSPEGDGEGLRADCVEGPNRYPNRWEETRSGWAP